MSSEEIGRRSALAAGLASARYPATREDLLAAARSDGEGRLVPVLRHLPEGQSFETLEQVWEALGREHGDAGQQGPQA